MPANMLNKGGSAQSPTAAPAGQTKAGWKVKQWADDVGCSVSRTWELIAEQRIESVKFGASRIILTPPGEFLRSLKGV
jgi:hypothetical protein